MKMKRFCTFAVAALIGGSMAQPALAQTARIAHLSHGGSLETLDAEADNFGNVRPMPPRFAADSVLLLTDTTALEYGRWVRGGSDEKTHVVKFGEWVGDGSKPSPASYYKQYHPNVKIIGSNTTVQAAAPPQLSPSVPVLKKQKIKRKKSAFIPVAPAPPQRPGVALGVALMLGLAGAGWLLGERRVVVGS